MAVSRAVAPASASNNPEKRKCLPEIRSGHSRLVRQPHSAKSAVGLEQTQLRSPLHSLLHNALHSSLKQDPSSTGPNTLPHDPRSALENCRSAAPSSSRARPATARRPVAQRELHRFARAHTMDRSPVVSPAASAVPVRGAPSPAASFAAFCCGTTTPK